MDEYELEELLDILSERALKRKRELGLTTKAFCHEAQMDRTSLYRFTHAKRTPRADDIVKLARVLNTSTDYLLGLADAANSKDSICLQNVSTKDLLAEVKRRMK